MFLVEAIKIAIENLTRHKLRTALTMLGIIFGVSAVLSMLSIGAGAENEALSVIRKMGMSNVVVQAKKFDPEERKVIRQDSPGLSRRDLKALLQVLPEGTVSVGKRALKTHQIISDQGKSDSQVWGVGALYSKVAPVQLVEGAFFIPQDETSSLQYCVLGRKARRKLFGINEAVGRQIKINEEWFTVIGVLADELIEKEEFEGVKVSNPNNDIYLPLGTLLNKFELESGADELDEIIVRLPENADVAQQAAVISQMMAGMHRQIDDYSLVVPQRLLQQARQTQRIFNIVMGAIASISLLVGGIGIMNIMLASVLERTSEIGLRRALGARRRDVGRQFVLEAVTISVGGALIGIMLGFAISSLVSVYSGWPTIVTPFSVILGVGVSTTVGLIFGIYPARQAARVSPIEALRYE